MSEPVGDVGIFPFIVVIDPSHLLIAVKREWVSAQEAV